MPRVHSRPTKPKLLEAGALTSELFEVAQIYKASNEKIKIWIKEARLMTLFLIIMLSLSWFQRPTSPEGKSP